MTRNFTPFLILSLGLLLWGGCPQEVPPPKDDKKSSFSENNCDDCPEGTICIEGECVEENPEPPEVTDAGVARLQRKLPELKIVR